ncbi:putative ribulose-5-phosphate 3-epimerase [Leptomonas seymouri]|uniref:Ribulose-phosphate 3-epimerase n=1 Tax=Leptomonas seymouri TaxID=5684 RepID=A0A0N0P388_LEPSE|nr:putative ribulose-5-phosphate 3-epimerase [Leptomonas seymouri]|eukprot:KPI83377.1 putative ribulose-5-phosphate 3-epimerase [Leptomonas seymouri]
MFNLYNHQDKSTWLNAMERPNAPLQAIISPSILAADFCKLGEEVESVLSPAGGAVEWIHVDVMDGHMVPNISIGPGVVASLRGTFPNAFLDVHCMVSDPAKWVPEMAKAGASAYVFHIEATDDSKHLCKLIRSHELQVGVAIKPATGLTQELRELIEERYVDMVLVMTVEPGFGGQSFMKDRLSFISELRRNFPKLNIGVDGGVAPGTAELSANAGANILIAGTCVFKAKDRKAAVDEMRNSVVAALAGSAN